MKKFKSIIPIVFSLCIVFLFAVKRVVILKYYPPLINFTVFLIFFTSLFAKETVIQKIAKAYEGKLDEKALDYTRKATYAWCVFTFLNTLISFVTIFLSDRVWIFYNGFLTYILTGLMFISEYIVRIIYKKRNNA